ncbi:MAG: hypothetical protein M3R57_00155 [Chloroflexota bacterium]|nr:hypothetical protein [Chloroflexota bacterium]
MPPRVAREGEPAAGPMTNAVLDFRPSRHGLHFANRFEPGPTVKFGPFDPRIVGIGDAAAGLCGGMALTVRDLYEKRIDPPPDRDAPVNGSPRFRALVRRQVQSLDWFRLPLRFYSLSALHPSVPSWWSRLLGRRSMGDLVLDEEWPAIRTEIDGGHLAMVGLVRGESFNPFKLTANHQVLAYGYRVAPDQVTLRLYDPNHPDGDEVEARMNLVDGRATTFESSTGEPLRGFFLAPYKWAEPRAWKG